MDKQDVLLFVAFYVLSTLIYYTATWISWGTFSQGFRSYFNVEEFFAAAGTQFILNFLITIPIWYATFILLKNYSLRHRLATHVLFLPLFVAASYYAQLGVTELFGWAMFWGGNKAVWTLYNLMLFYLVQFGFIHAYTYLKQLKKDEAEKAALREIALKSEMTALKAQLNPHFLHNLFNSISATLPPENERTRELIIQLSDLFRYQNYAAQNEYVTLREEMAFIENYLELMKVRLKERLHYRMEVPAALNDFKIVPMLLHPIVENAITHGIAPKIGASHLFIKVHHRDGKTHFSIEDTGLGIPDKTAALSQGLGLSNTKLRLEKIYGSDLAIEDNVPCGTILSFAI